MKSKFFNIIKCIVTSTVLSFLFFFLFNTLIRLIFQGEHLNFFIYCINLITYAVFFGISYSWKRIRPYYLHGEKFNVVGELKAYAAKDAKPLLFVLVVLAILCDLSYLIPRTSPGNLIVTLCSMVFPFFVSIKIPVLRSIGSLLIAFLVVAVGVCIKSYKLYKEDKKQYKGEKEL